LSGRGLCDELITRPEESYRLCCVVVCDLETSRRSAPYIYDISNLRIKGVSHLRQKQDLPAVSAVESHINELRRGMSDAMSRTKMLVTCWYLLLREIFTDFFQPT